MKGNTMEILAYYILPNIALFGSIIMLSKGIEYLTWKLIVKYNDLVETWQIS
jgi:hypothetical protein